MSTLRQLIARTEIGQVLALPIREADVEAPVMEIRELVQAARRAVGEYLAVATVLPARYENAPDCKLTTLSCGASKSQRHCRDHVGIRTTDPASTSWQAAACPADTASACLR
jgi:hypothetical protein